MSILNTAEVGLHFKRSCKNGIAYMHLGLDKRKKGLQADVGRFAFVANNGRVWAHVTAEHMVTIHQSRYAAKYNPDAWKIFIEWSNLLDKACELDDFSILDEETWFVPRKNRRTYQKGLAAKTPEELPSEEEWYGLLERNIITNDYTVSEGKHFGEPFDDEEQSVTKEDSMTNTKANSNSEQSSDRDGVYIVMAAKNGTTTPVMAFDKRDSAEELMDSLSVANEVTGTRVLYSVRGVRYKV